MSSDSITVLLGCTGSILLFALVIAYIITSARREKSTCPKCTKKSAPKKTYVIDDETGNKVEGERDFGFAMVSGIGGLLI